jgi:YbbR domain-containing protein
MIKLLRNLIFKDFWLKLFSFGLAIVLWLIVSIAIQNEVVPGASLTQRLTQRTITNLPVVFMSSATDVREIKVSPQHVEVTVQGDVKTLDQLQDSDIRAIIDLTDVSSARDLRKRIHVSTPAGITHVRVEPPEVRISIPARR